MRRDVEGISTLLDLHEQIIDQGGGYWIKIEAWQVPATADIPHGVRYSTTTGTGMPATKACPMNLKMRISYFPTFSKKLIGYLKR